MIRERAPSFENCRAGRPNVGKSSLVNRLLNEDRVIVSDVAGTTRDAIDIPFTLKCGDEDVSAVLVDTAGLRKKSKIDEAVERYSMMRAEEALENADICPVCHRSDNAGFYLAGQDHCPHDSGFRQRLYHHCE